MCGIVAYVGDREAQPILLDALSRLEYRGYDSAGVALLNGGGIEIVKKAGRIQELGKLLKKKPAKGHTGISHTRWATHGEANDTNAHPHTDQSGKLALVHNGVIENYLSLRTRLEADGSVFKSHTDTEVLAHLLGWYYGQSRETGPARLIESVRHALAEVKGTYGIAVVHQDHPGLVVGARKGSPLILGLGQNENFLASDAQALMPYTQKVVYLKDDDVVSFTPTGFTITTTDSDNTSYEIATIEKAEETAPLGDFPHYMLKEISEQALAVTNACRGRLSKDESTAHLGGLNMTPAELRKIDRVMILACGTALYSGMVGKHMIESLAKIPVEVDHASEFRYRDCPLNENTLFFVVSQSGETADTIGALREARRRGFRTLGICNTVGSTIARETDGGIYMHAGAEIGVAATKSFVSQCTIFGQLALLLGRLRYLSASNGREIISAFEELPHQINAVLGLSPEIRKVAERYCESRSMLFLGRYFNYPTALEGALKMKEITYIHAEGYPSAELKHGVIALIDKETPSVIICPQDGVYDKNMNNIAEIKARNGRVLAIASEGDREIKGLVDDVIHVPRTLDVLQPILNVIPLQLFAYHTAVLLGRDVDKPRNLAKSVTVE